MALASVLLGWGDRDLCFSDNSKDLKNKEIPGIQLRWDMESPWGTWLSCPPKLLGTGSTCWPRCPSIQSKKQGWGTGLSQRSF